MSRKRSHDDVSEDDVFVYYEDTDLSSIPNDITALRIDSSVRVIPPRAFYWRHSLVSVEYQEGLQVIGEQSFWGCTSLKNIQQFPSTLVEIGIQAFSECGELESVGRLPLSLKVIGDAAFASSQCSKLQSVIEIPNPECSLGGDVFGGCNRLTYVRLPEGLKIIPHGLFSRCFSLVDVNVPSSVVEIGYRAFWKCISITNFDLPSAIVEIGNKAFHTCERLTNLDLSQCNLTSIGYAAFARCKQLKCVLLPRAGLKLIEDFTFEKCTSLTHLWIPRTVKSIGKCAFANCTKLLSVEVPESLEHLRLVTSFEEVNEEGEIIEIRYKALVNLHLPPSDLPNLRQVDYSSAEEALEHAKLGVAADGYQDLVRKLRGRFNSLPIHRACYFQSYCTPQETIESIRKITTVDPAACSQLDFVGMNPFHILALSHTPSLDIFEELLTVSSVDVLKCRDVFGCTALDYLCKNIHSTRAVDVTKSLLSSVILEHRVPFLGLDRWRVEVFSGLERVQTADSASLGAEVASVVQKCEEYERLETLSLLEMAVWRMKVDEVTATRKDTRESCRVNCGSSIVLTNVMSFLDRATP